MLGQVLLRVVIFDLLSVITPMLPIDIYFKRWKILTDDIVAEYNHFIFTVFLLFKKKFREFNLFPYSFLMYFIFVTIVDNRFNFATFSNCLLALIMCDLHYKILSYDWYLVASCWHCTSLELLCFPVWNLFSLNKLLAPICQ